MARTEAQYRNVIQCIHERWLKGEPFAAWEIQKTLNISISTINRILIRLRNIGLIARNVHAYQSRFYRVTVRWPSTVAEAIEYYEMAQILKIG